MRSTIFFNFVHPNTVSDDQFVMDRYSRYISYTHDEERSWSKSVASSPNIRHPGINYRWMGLGEVMTVSTAVCSAWEMTADPQSQSSEPL